MGPGQRRERRHWQRIRAGPLPAWFQRDHPRARRAETPPRGGKIRLLVIDAIKASWTDEETDKKVLNAVTGVQLTMLINNVRGAGAARGAWAPIMQRSAGELDALINLNAAFMTQMTRVLIPVLAQRQRAAIVNISSAAELVPAPYLVAYSAAKAYVSRCSVSLDAELRVESQGHIDVHSLIVGAVATPNASHD
ncbi:hypothetical protein A1O7_00192 [Cladophialophora yegresii CBS 114405]|uniref:Oxidoreductase n=1 Tax=Cladophialophora yegresii CBS 114405 TaxID=1182544 RepID=W9W716_9EURO|nr:uncharacterized protein A1O7_00192 [Cladophialophora yegresii CBS 114405]EXJ63857.1 hypothetical protein A1O7_00192 [Cladophialophora yegresii CBS 114405]